VDTYAADVARAPDCSCHNIAHTKPCRRWTRWATKSRTSRKGTRRRETESWEDTWWPVRRNENKRTEQLRARRGYGQPVASGGREGIPRQSTSPGRRFRRAVNDEPFDPSNIIGKRILVARWTTPLAPFKLGFYISRSDFTSLPCLVEPPAMIGITIRIRHAPDWQDMRDFFSNVIHLRSPARDICLSVGVVEENVRARNVTLACIALLKIDGVGRGCQLPRIYSDRPEQRSLIGGRFRDRSFANFIWNWELRQYYSTISVPVHRWDTIKH